MSRSDLAFDFIPFPIRSSKPRDTGITMVIDKAISWESTSSLPWSLCEYFDIVKFGWGTSRILSKGLLSDKIKIYRAKGIGVMPGGTLLEIAAMHGKEDEFLSFSREAGFTHIEVSNGTFNMAGMKPSLIRKAIGDGFSVLSEVGKKTDGDGFIPLPRNVVREWIDEAKRDLDSGASKVILEGRESGTCGIYDPDGSVRFELIDPLTREIPIASMIFEAPQKRQQVHFILTYGNGVNLGNIAPEDVISLETLRLGLRGDTAVHYHAKEEEAWQGTARTGA